MTFTPRTPSLAEAIAAAIDSRLQSVHVAIPGRVERFDEEEQVADVQPLLLLPLVDEDGNETTERLPVFPNVPVVFPRAGGMSITLPVAVGDNVLVVFAERSLDLWKARGGEVNPVDQTFHSLTGAVCFPGCYPSTDSIPSFSTNKIVIGKDGVGHSPAARKNDSVKVTLTEGPTGTMAALMAQIAVNMTSAGGPLSVLIPSPTTAVDITGTITAGSDNVEIGD